MERRRAAEDSEEFKAVVRGWCIGSEEFRNELLAQMSQKAGAEHFGEEIRESAEQKAERIVVAELKRLGWNEKTLAEASLCFLHCLLFSSSCSIVCLHC